MSPQTPAPDAEAIEAWLSGDLPEEKVREIEKYFDEHPPGDVSLDLTVGGISVDRKLAPDPELSELIDLVKTKHGTDQPAPSADAWKEVLTPSENPDLLGTLGSYEVLEVIATGGMGILLKARDPELNRVAALKVLSPELATNATARERFLREARAAAKLEHENILPIYGVHAEAVPYFAMRHAGGGSLQDALEAGRVFDTDELKTVTRQIAAALSSAHAAGIVHRDIKPGNILLDEDSDQVWVCDFGIARSIEDPALTYAGGIAGTPQYMSPEQAAGDELDGRSDLFSLGAVLYRCVTGENAFAGTTTASTLQKVAREQQTELSVHKAKVPRWFERLLANLLAKDPRDRPCDAAAVVAAIDDEHSPRPKHTERRNRRLIVAALAILGVAALCIGVLQVPAVRSLANSALGARFEQVFTISGKLGAYPSLADAIEAADDDDTIELPATGSIAVDKLELPTNKALTFRPAKAGTRPILATRITGAPGIIAKAPLHLVGLDFSLNPRDGSDGIVIASGSAAVLKVEDCKFTARRQVRNRYNEVKARCIDLVDGANAQIIACEFDLEETNAVTFYSSSPEVSATGSVLVRDTRMSAFFGINQLVTFQSRIEINVEDLKFTGESFLKSSKRGGMAPTSCVVADSEFELVGPLCWLGMSDAAAAKRAFHWRGTRNKYPNGLAHVRVARSHAGDPDSLLPITGYGGLGAIVGGLMPNPSEGFVEIEGAGERYTDLASACAAAPEGATLFLTGTLDCIGKIHGHSLHLRAAAGARPILVARDPIEHAIFLFGKSSVTGICFTREIETEFSLPVLGLKSDGQDVVVEDCEFVVTKAGTIDGADALSLTDVGTATIRRCVFSIQYGVGISISFRNDTTLPAHVQVEDSLFIGPTAIATLARQASTSTHITAKRCIAVGDQFFAMQKYGQLGAIHLGIEESILAPQQQMLYLPDVASEDLASHLVWTGRSNYYAQGMRPFHESRSDAPDTVESLAKFISADETGAKEFPPIDRRKLDRNITVEVLREALPRGIESPALKALELLDSGSAGSGG